MTTSNVTTNQLTRNGLIEMAVRKLGVVADGQTLSTENYTNGSAALNTLLGAFRTLGMPLWARQSYDLTLTAGTSSYNIGSSQTLNTPYPLKLLQAYRTDSNNSSKVQLEIIPDYNFNRLPTGSSGYPIQISYTPKVNLGVIKLWPTPDATAVANTTVTIVYQRPMEYMSSSTDTFDIPEEWLEAVVYNLAVRLAPEWGVPLPDRKALKNEADEYLEMAKSFGAEDGSIFWQIDRRG